MLKTLSAVFVSVVSSSFVFIGHAAAATKELCTGNGPTFLGFPTWYKYLLKSDSFNEATQTCNLTPKFPDDIGKIALAIVEILLRVGGLLAVFFVVYGGFKYITSQGEPEKTKNARQTIINAVIGLMISIIATTAVAFIGREFIK